MKKIVNSFFLLIPFLVFSQNIQVDWTTYTAQELIEDILIDSDCIENVVISNVVGGNFDTADESYGYFDASGSPFPFSRGIVLSTGKLINTEGPNTSLGSDNAPNWIGDSDLEAVLNESNTINATILEFDFTSVASQISFRYIFASEEYVEGEPNTCNYSDLFGFLIRPTGSSTYTNIALVPNTNTPVKVTTVTPGISGSCPPINELYFESFNGAISPINFNGQTKVMTATANVAPNETYHVKLVIADHINYQYDSAVFLEAGSFELSTDLGSDLLIVNDNALCGNETYELDASQSGANNYAWYKDGVLLPTEINATYTVIDAGTYNVEVTLDNSCISYGAIIVEYAPYPTVFDTVLITCDLDQDGITIYNLFDAEQDITNGDTSLIITDFFLTEIEAIQNTNPIPNPTGFENTVPQQIVFANIKASSSCSSIVEITLDISTNTVNISPQNVCSDNFLGGFSSFDLDVITASFQSQIPTTAVVSYYETEDDANNEINALTSPYRNTITSPQIIYAKIIDGNSCFALEEVVLNVLDIPILLGDSEVFYCTNLFPDTIRLFADVQNGSPDDYTYQWIFNNVITSVDTYYYDTNEVGEYTIIVTGINNCSSSRIITVSSSSNATIEEILIEEGTYNNTVTIEVSGDGIYEYALDDPLGNYQESNIFTDVFPGFHTVYVRDINGCKITSEPISVLGFPRYFTPNNDGTHDTWMVYGVNEQFNQEIDIQIYNRFGKILARLNHLSEGWDGTYNGVTIPSDDYWYLVLLVDGRTYRGHFALKR